MKKINTLRFGEVEIAEEEIICFADGIPGFEEEHEFLVIPYDEESPFVFLQSAKTPELAFLMTSPFVFFPEYELEIDDATLETLQINQEEDILVYSLLTLPGKNIKLMTANLLAPVIINQNNRAAKQIILDQGQYTTKHRLFPETDDESKGDK